MEKYSNAVSERYSKAVSEMYSQFKQREVHPMEKYIGRLAYFRGKRLEVVGFSHDGSENKPLLIVDASQSGGWSYICDEDVVFKRCEAYGYVTIKSLID